MALRVPEHLYEPHKSGHPLYIDADHRLCPGCPADDQIHSLKHFRPHSKNGKFAVLCYRCMREDKKVNSESTHEKAVSTLTKAIDNASRRYTKNTTLAEMMNSLAGPMGGRSKVFHALGMVHKRVLNKAAEEDASLAHVSQAIKVGDSIIKAFSLCERTKPVPVDLSNMTEEEMREILMEPARQLILQDKGFRDELLSDFSVRKQLLSDLNVTVVESTAEEVDDATA